MKRNRSIRHSAWLPLVVLLAMAACVKVQFKPAAGVESYPPTDSLVVFKSIPEREYIVLGDIFANGDDTGRILGKIKAQAMAVGAEAIILTPARQVTQKATSQTRTEFENVRVQMRAIAIRFKK